MKAKHKYRGVFLNKAKLLIFSAFAILSAAIVFTSLSNVIAKTSDWKETDVNGDSSNLTVEEKYFETYSSGEHAGELIKYSTRSVDVAPHYTELFEDENGVPHLKNALPLNYLVFEFEPSDGTAKFAGVNMVELKSAGFSFDKATHKYRNGSTVYDALDIPSRIYRKETTGEYAGFIRAYNVTSIGNSLSDLAFKFALTAVHYPDTVTYISPAALYGAYNLEYLESPIVGRTLDNGSTTYVDGDEVKSKTYSELKSETLGSMFFGSVASFDDAAIQSSFENPEFNLAGWPKDEDGISFSNVIKFTQIPYELFPASLQDYADHISGRDDRDNDGNPICPLWYLENASDIDGVNGAVYETPKSLKYVKITKEEGLVVRSFFNWRYLKEVWLPDSCRNLSNERVFAYCESLENIRLPRASSTSIGKAFFSYCKNLKYLTLPINLENISEGMLFKCLELEQVNIPSTVKYIENGAFAYCSSIVDYRIYGSNPGTRTEAGDNPGRSWGFNLPPALQKIGTSAFLNNQGITNVDIPSSVTEIGANAFQSCINISSMTIPFVGKSRSAGQPASHEQVFGWIFGSSNQGWSIGSESPVSADAPSATDSSILTSVYTANEKVGTAQIGYAIPNSLKTLNIKDETNLLEGSLQSLTSIESMSINEGCGTIALGALGCITNANGDVMHLRELIVPNLGAENTFGSLFGKVEYTGAYPAENHNGSTYYIPTSLKSIEITHMATMPSWSFDNLEVTSVKIGEYTTVMSNYVFHGNDYLEKLTVPFSGIKRGFADRKTLAGYGIFGAPYYNDRYFPTVTMEDSFFRIFSPYKVGNEYAFWQYDWGGNSSKTPVNKFAEYRRFIPISLTELVITDDTAFDGNAFDGMFYIKKLEIKKATFIDQNALGGLSSLVEVSLPFIGKDYNEGNASGRGHTFGWIFDEYSGGTSSAFYVASEHGNYLIPKTLKKISIGSTPSVPNYAFAGLSTVETITLGTKVSSIGTYAFYNNTKLKDLNYLGGTEFTTVPDYAFYGCKLVNENNFYKIVGNDNVNYIGNYAFAYTNVRSAIPAEYLGGGTNSPDVIDFTKINHIGDHAFYGSAGIEYAEVPANVDYLGPYAFANCTFLTYAKLAEGKVVENLFNGDIRLNNLNLIQVTNTIPKGFFNGCTSITIVDEVKYSQNSVNNGGIGAPNNGIVLDPNTTEFKDYAFANCAGLTEFTFPGALTTIGNYVFVNDRNLLPMTLPKHIVNIGQHNWDGVRTPEQSEYYFWVYFRESEWPKGWKENWNCSWPVYVIGDTSEYMFTYEYNKEYSGYLITGVEQNITLPEFLVLPSKHHGLPVVGIVNCDYLGKVGDAGASLSSVTAKDLKKIIVPSTYKVMADGIFGQYDGASYKAVEVYTEMTKAQVLANVKVIKPTTTGKPLEALTSIEDVLKWAPSSGSAVFTKEDWEYGDNGANKNIPYIPLSKLTYELELTLGNFPAEKYTYDGLPKEPTILAAVLPGICGATYNKLLYSKYGEYKIGERTYAPIFSSETPIFKLSYQNNVLAGKAQAIVSLNNQKYEYNFLSYPEILISGNDDYSYTTYTKTSGTGTIDVFDSDSNIFDTPYNVYNRYIRTSDQLSLYDMNFSGTASLDFIINKKNITLFPYSFGNPDGYWSWDHAEYTGEKWTFSSWDSTNVQWGAEGTVTNAFRFVGSISTTSKNVKLITDVTTQTSAGTGSFSIYNNGYYQSQPFNSTNENNITVKIPADIVVDKGWNVYDSVGRDITSNFTVSLGYVRVKIVPMTVTVKWINDDGTEASWNSESLTGQPPVKTRSNQDVYYDGTQMKTYPAGISSTFKSQDYTSVLIYPYKAKDILPAGQIVRYSENDNLNGQIINDSAINLIYSYFNNGNPHAVNGTDHKGLQNSYNAAFMYPNYIPGQYNGADYDPAANLVASAYITESGGRHNYDLLYYDGTALDAEYKADGTLMDLDNPSTYYDRWGKPHNSNEGRLGQIIYQGYYISKGKVRIEVVSNSWVIGVNDDCFQYVFNENTSYPGYIRVSGVGVNSYVNGTLASMIFNQTLDKLTGITNKKGVYTKDGLEPDSNNDLYVIRWRGDFADDYLVNLGTATGGQPDKYHYGIYNNRAGVKEYENQYYDEIELFVNLTLLYNKFNTDFRIDNQVVYTELNSIGDAAEQKAVYIEYVTRGLNHVFTATDKNPSIFNGTIHDALTTITYNYNDGVSDKVTPDPFNFILLNEYAVGVRFERKNFDSMYYQVRIVVVPDNVRINSDLSKVYDGNPLMIVGDVIQAYNSLLNKTTDQNLDGKVDKLDAMLAFYRHDAEYNFLDEYYNITTDPSKYYPEQTGTQIITYNYYDSANNHLAYAPSNVGEYWIEIDVHYITGGNYGDPQFASASSVTPNPPERERFFNEYKNKIKFRITQREIVIDLSRQFIDLNDNNAYQGGKLYDKKAAEIDFTNPTNANMIVAGSLVKNDIFTGQAYTVLDGNKSAEPGYYGNGRWAWYGASSTSTGWQVLENASPFENHTGNYKIRFENSFRIEYRTFDVSASDATYQYDFVPHTINFTVGTPIENATIRFEFDNGRTITRTFIFGGAQTMQQLADSIIPKYTNVKCSGVTDDSEDEYTIRYEISAPHYRDKSGSAKLKITWKPLILDFDYAAENIHPTLENYFAAASDNDYKDITVVFNYDGLPHSYNITSYQPYADIVRYNYTNAKGEEVWGGKGPITFTEVGNYYIEFYTTNTNFTTARKYMDALASQTAYSSIAGTTYAMSKKVGPADGDWMRAQSRYARIHFIIRESSENPADGQAVELTTTYSSTVADSGLILPDTHSFRIKLGESFDAADYTAVGTAPYLYKKTTEPLNENVEFYLQQNSSAISGNWPAGFHVLYSVDDSEFEVYKFNDENFLKTLPRFSDVGTHIIKIKVLARGLAPLELEAKLVINPATFDSLVTLHNLQITDYGPAEYDGEFHQMVIEQQKDTDQRYIEDKVIDFRFEYTDNLDANNNHVDEGFTKEPYKYKDAGVYRNYVRLVAPNYITYYMFDPVESNRPVIDYLLDAPTTIEDQTKPYVGDVEILQAELAGIIEYKEIQFSKNALTAEDVIPNAITLENNALLVDEKTIIEHAWAKDFGIVKAGNKVFTVHDGPAVALFYEMDNLNPLADDVNAPQFDYNGGNMLVSKAPTTNPVELGYYYVEVTYMNTNNCKEMKVAGFIKIVPRILEVKYSPEEEYNGALLDPLAYVETGNDDEIIIIENLDTVNSDNPEAIKIGTYYYDLEMYMVSGDAENYRLDTNRIEFHITKRHIYIEITDVVHPYDMNKWTLYSNEFNDSEYNIYIKEGSFIEDHKLRLQLETQSYIATKYVYDSQLVTQPSNRVNISMCKVYRLTDPLDITTEEDISELYDITFKIIVSIVYPELELLSTEQRIKYDGNPHKLNISALVPSYVRGWRALYSVSEEAYLNQDETQFILYNEWTYTNAGEYHLYIYMTAYMYNPGFFDLVLIIEPADLSIELTKIDNDADDDFDLIFNGYDNNVLYTTTGIVKNEELDIRKVYIPKSKYTALELVEYIGNNIDNALVFEDATDTLYDAGEYWAIVYSSNAINTNYVSAFAYHEVTIEKRPLKITYPTAFHAVEVWNGSKFSYLLGESEIDLQMLINGHYIYSPAVHNDPTARRNYILTSSIRTKGSNAGIYSGEDGFEFDDFVIWAEDKQKNVAQNYRPVIGDDFDVEIQKVYLSPETFVIETPYTKTYDGKVNIPPIDTLSDGIIKYVFYGYNTDTLDYDIALGEYYTNSVITLPALTYAGKYKVLISISEGTNHYAYPQPTDAGYPDGIEAYVECEKKALQVYWEDLELDFNAEQQKPKAYFLKEDGEKSYLDVEFYDVNTGKTEYSKLNAGEYEVEAKLNNPIDEINYRLFEEKDRLELYADGLITEEEYYAFPIKTAIFKINKLLLVIPLGDVSVDSSARWSKSFDGSIFVGQAVYDLISSKNLQFFDEAMTGKSVIRTYHEDDERILSGTYDSIEEFELDINITTLANTILGIPAIRVTDSFYFDVTGKVTLESKDIIYTKTSVIETTYNNERIRPSDYISIAQPKGKSTNVNYNGVVEIEYSMDYDETTRQGTWSKNEPTIINVGTYVVYFRMFDNSDEYGKGDKYNSTGIDKMTIIIDQKESYLQFTRNGLDKVYDDVPINKSTVSLVGGYNGTANDLVFKIYRGPIIEKDLNGNPTNLMTTDPIDVGTYLLVVTSSADATATTKNYTDLYIEHVFKISERTIKLNLDLDYQSIAFGTAKYTQSASLNPGTGYNVQNNTGLCPYDKLDYSVLSYGLIERGYYSYLLSQIQPSNENGKFTKDAVYLYKDGETVTPETILEYKILSSTRIDSNTSAPLDITTNYVVDLNLKLNAHYPYIRAKIENVNAVYDGNEHGGTPVITSAPGVLPTGSSYSETEFTLNDPAYRLNISDMRFTYSTVFEPLEFESNGNLKDGSYNANPIVRTLPGSTRVYYRIQSTTDPHEVYEGSYVINVSKMNRTVAFPDLADKVYDNTPYGYQDIDSKYTVDDVDYYYYLPCNWNNILIQGKNGVTDDFDRSAIQVYYRKNNSNQNLNEAIDAAEYTVYLVIPESTYYKKSTTKATFRINQAIIYIRDTETPLEVGYNGDTVEYSNFDGSNMYATVDVASTSQNLTYNGMNLSIVGILATSGNQIGRYKEGSDLGNLVWRSINSEFTGDSKRFYIYDNIQVGTDVDKIDVTENFIINIKDASIFIKGSDMHVENLEQEVVYTGGQINPNFDVIVPAITSITSFKYRVAVPGEDQPNIDHLDSNWISNINDQRISPTNVGIYEIWVLLDAPNYNKCLFKYKTTIVKNKVKITIPDQSKEYDALPVLEPINFYPNTPQGETVDRTKYTIIYKEWDVGAKDFIALKNGYEWPTNVGRYKIEVTVPGTLNFEGGSFEREFTISPRRLVITDASWGEKIFVYNSAPQAPTLSHLPLPIGLTEAERLSFADDNLEYTITQVTGGNAEHSYVGVYQISVDVKSANYTLAGMSTINYTITQKNIVIQISASLFQNSYYEFYQFGKNGFDPFNNLDPDNIVKYIDSKQATYSFNTYPSSSAEYTVNSSAGLEGNDHFRTKLVLTKTNVGLHTRYPASSASDFFWFDESVDITDPNFATTYQITSANYKPIISRTDGAVEDVTDNYRISYKLSVLLDFNTTNLIVDSWAGPYDGQDHTINYVVGNIGSYTVSYRTDPTDPWTELPLVNIGGDKMIPDKEALPKYKNVARNGDGSIGFYTIYLMVKVGDLAAKTTEGTVTIYPFNPGLTFKHPYETVDKVYDALPYNNPEVTFAKSGVTTDPKFEYYQLIENPLNHLEEEHFLGNGARPTNVGHYRLKVSVASGQNFDNSEITRDFYITKRPLDLYINGGNKITFTYNGDVWRTNVTNDMFSKIHINNIEVDGIAPGDVSTAAVRNGSVFEAVPNVYQTVLSDVKLVLDSGTGQYKVGSYNLPDEFTWKNGKFFVYRGSVDNQGNITLATIGSGTGVALIETTDNYDLNIHADIEIQKATIKFDVASYEGIFNGVNATVNVNVEEPQHGYTIWYTTDPVNGTWSTTPISRSMVGTTTVYVKVTAPNYLDASSSGTINIRPIPLPVSGGENPPSSWQSGMSLVMNYVEPNGTYTRVTMKFDEKTATWTNTTKIPNYVTELSYTLTPYYPAKSKIFKDSLMSNEITAITQSYTYPDGENVAAIGIYGALLQGNNYVLDNERNPAGRYNIRVTRLLPEGPASGSDSIDVKLYYYDQNGVRQEATLGYDKVNSNWSNNDLLPSYVTKVYYEITSNFIEPDTFDALVDKVEETTVTPYLQLNVNNSQLNQKALSNNTETIGLLLTRTGAAVSKPYTLTIRRADPNNPTPSVDPTATKLEVIYEVNIGGTTTKVSVPLTFDIDEKKWTNINKLPANISYVKVKFSEYPAAEGGNHVSVYDDSETPVLIPLNSYVSQNLTGESTAFNYDIYQSGNSTPSRYVLEITKEEPTSIDNGAIEYDKNYVYNGEPYMSKPNNGRPRYNTVSTGAQTITYYLPTDLETPIAGDGMALTAPINAGDYVMVIDVAADGSYASASITQTFTIKKLEVEVEWSDLELEYDGTQKSPTAKFKDISGNDITLPLTATSTQTNAGKYTGSLKATAKIDSSCGNDTLGNAIATNYTLKADTISTDWEITHKKVDLPELAENKFEYLDEIIFKATSGDIYEMDTFGNIIKWTKPDNTIGDTTELEFRIVPDVDKDPDYFYELDGVTVITHYTNHKFTIQLKDTTNTMWSNKTPTDADKSADVTGEAYTYVIEPKDLSDKTKYEIIVEYETPQIYDEKPKEPVTKVSYKDLSTNVITDLVIYTESDPDNPPVITNINEAQCVVTYKDNVKVTRAYSGTPDDTSIPEHAQIIVDGFHFYKFNNEDYTFEIKRNKPNTITLQDDAKLEFMQMTYDFDSKIAYISENHIDMPRTLPNQPDIFLGHIVQKTKITDVLTQIKNDSDCLRFYNAKNELIDSQKYSDESLGTNWRIELYASAEDAAKVNDDTVKPIDSIKALVFGDLDGDGMITPADRASIQKILNDTTNTVFRNADELLFYFAACTDKTAYLNTENQNYAAIVSPTSRAAIQKELDNKSDTVILNSEYDI